MSDIQPVPEGTETYGVTEFDSPIPLETSVEKVQEPVRIQSEASTNADEVATVQEAGLVREELLNEEADGA